MVNLRDRVALVTGAGVRLGRSIALELAGAGCHVAVHYGHSETEANDTAGQVERLGRRAEVFQADLTETAVALDLPARVEETFGRLDIIVNSAAAMEPGGLGDVTPEVWDRAMDLNVRAAFFLVQGAADALRRAKGSIVNIADAAGFQAWADYIPLSVSKAGMVMLTKCLAKALAPDVRVNAVAPGPVLLPDRSTPEDVRAAEESTVLGRLGRPEDVGIAVRFLLEGSEYITGAILPVDGGRIIR